MSLGAWIGEVVALHAKAQRALRVEVVHDLRVAIRRVRSLAQGLREVDDDGGAARWKTLSDLGRALFAGLGELRDAQVMKEHATALLATDPALGTVLAAIDARIDSSKIGARAAVGAFDAHAWRAAASDLPARAGALLAERPLFDHLGLRRFFEAKELHQAAMRSKSSTSLHELRIGVKKLRYTVENFLPDVHDAVGKTLKKMQEVLGEVHDLDVLTMFIASEFVRLHSDDRSRAAAVVRAGRDALVAKYRDQVLGGAWPAVRAALPDGPAVPLAHRALMLKKGGGHGVDVARARALERAALTLVFAFEKEVRALKDARAKVLTRWACACALVDGGGKPASKLARRLPLAIGFTSRDRALLAVVARAAVDRAPGPGDPRVDELVARDRAVAVALGAVLHFASALVSAGPFVVRRGREVVVLDTASPILDARAFAERRGALEALVGAPFWWKSAPAPPT